MVVHKYFLFCPCIKCAPLWVSQSPTGVPDVVLYLLSSACQILSISEMHKVGRTTTRTAPFAKHEPDSLLCESRGISYWQIEDFMAYTATLNSIVMKARRSITHLFVFLLLWITVSIADSSLEWNENKTIIHLVKLCRKGERLWSHSEVQPCLWDGSFTLWEMKTGSYLGEKRVGSISLGARIRTCHLLVRVMCCACDDHHLSSRILGV